MVLALLVSGCGELYRNVAADGEGGCELEPVGAAPIGFGFGVQRVAATLCGSEVEVEGRIYEVECPMWLVEEALVLEAYGSITAANVPVGDPTVYSLPGVDPQSLLVGHGSCSPDQAGASGEYWVLDGLGFPLTAGVCRYADPSALAYPTDVCPIETGRIYHVSLIVECGFEVPIGPLGGEYWRVVDPPAAYGDGGYDGIYSGQGVDFGYLELVDADHASYRSEAGAVLQLVRITEVDQPAAAPCPNRFQ
jgi:hypothetical protein